MNMAIIALVVAAAANSQDAEREVFQNWFVINETDPLTDLSRGIAVTEADNGAALVVKCDIMNDAPGDMYVSYIADDFLGEGRNNGRRDLIYRVDDREPVEVSASHDGRTAAVFGRTGANEIVSALMQGETVFFRARSYDYDNRDARFNLIGSTAAITRAYELCDKVPPAP